MTRKKSSQSGIRRRTALKGLGCAALTNTSLLSTFLNLQATKSAVAAGTPGDYKALVCLFLYGGNDSFNMLVPTDGDDENGEYGDYFTARGTTADGGIALAQQTLLPIAGPSGRGFGLHPEFGWDVPDPDDPTDTGNNNGPRGIHKLYQDANLSFVANVGSLVRPTNKTDHDNKSDLPLGLFSHSDLVRHWMTTVPNSRSQVDGWAGRMSDLLTDDCNDNPVISMNMSLNGVNLFQTGKDVFPYVIGTNGATEVNGYGNLNWHKDAVFTTAMDSILKPGVNANGDQSLVGMHYKNLLSQSLSGTQRNSVDAAISFNQAVDAVELDTPFADNGTGARMKKIAQVIGAASQLGQRRQVFFVGIGGFDNHTALLTAHPELMRAVSETLSSFYKATVELGVADKVTTFTASDFGRTLSSNGQGSDHAWGGNQIVMGGAVDGGKIAGQFPMSLVNPEGTILGQNGPQTLNLGRGRLIPTTSVDEFSQELALWFGVDPSMMSDVLPNIGNFAGAPPLNLFS